MLSTLSKRQCFFPLFKQFLETEMAWSQPIIVRECIFKNQNLCLRHVKGKMPNKTNLTSIKKQRKLWIKTIFIVNSMCCLLCYSANWLHFTLNMYEFQTLQYRHISM